GPKPSFDSLEFFGIVLFVLLISVILIGYKETIYTFPLIPHAIIMLSNQDMGMEALNELWLLYVVIGILVLAFIFHFIYYKVKLTLGKLGLSLLIFSAAYLISILGYVLDGKPFEFSIVMISSMGLIYAMLYVFYRSTNEKPYLDYLFKSLFYLSLVVILQTFTMIIIYFIDHAGTGSMIDILKLAIDERWGYIKDGFYVRRNVGWGVGNSIGGVLAYLLPIPLYYLFTDKKIINKILYGLSLILSIVTIVLTTSRGAYLGVVAFGIIFIYAFFRYVKIDYKKYKKQIIITASILGIIAILVFIFMYDFLISFMSTNSFLNGR